MSEVNPYAEPPAEVNPYAAPSAESYWIQPGDASSVWRSGKVLVMRKDAVLPDVCIKSNEATDGFRLKRKLFWHHPAIFLSVLLNLILYAILATVLGKRATIHIGLSETWRRKRHKRIWIAWSGVLAGAGIFVSAFFLQDPDVGVPVGILGFLTLLGFAIFGAVSARLVRVKKIDQDNIYLLGAHPDYLDRFESLG
ncbi:MAG: hypothetical protein AAF958_00705 [Planctomycetota bacterium]